jgi:hypothetical protein
MTRNPASRGDRNASRRYPNHGGDAEMIDIKRAATDSAAAKADATAKAEVLRKFTSWKTRLDAHGAMSPARFLD